MDDFDFGYDEEISQLQSDILRSSWCTPGFVKWHQMALVKRTAQESWDPLLETDGFCSPTISYKFWDILDQSIQADAGGQCANDSGLCYSWTQL